MKESKARVYLHYVWATHQRYPLITPEIEPALYRCIRGLANQQKCQVIALGGIADHVHLLVMAQTIVRVCDVPKHIKAISSQFVTDHFINQSDHALGFFAWQQGYGVFSVSPNHVDRVQSYVLNQKAHHAQGDLHQDWEPDD